MVSIMELLPLMVDEYGKPKGWKSNQNYLIENLLPGKAKHLGPFTNPGWLRYITLVTNNRYTSLIHTIWEKNTIHSPYQLFTDGNIRPGPVGEPWIDTYNVTADIYKLLWHPVPPQEFLKGTDMWIEAPSKDPTTGLAITTSTTITLKWHIIEIFNRQRFIDAMKEVLGASAGPAGPSVILSDTEFKRIKDLFMMLKEIGGRRLT